VAKGISIGAQVRELRRRRGLTQEELARAAGLSPQVIRKLEQGRGLVRFETLHAIARVLGVETVMMSTSTTPDPELPASEAREAALAEIRGVLDPPTLPAGAPLWRDQDVEQPDLPQLRQAVTKLGRLYDADRYDQVAQLAPALVRSAHYHVDALDRSREAVAVRADLLGIVGRYLIQVRQHDLASIALRLAIADAEQIENLTLISSIVSSRAWAMMRQARFGDAERLAVAWADNLEPRMSTASPEHVAAWGKLLRRAAGAAIRNNRPEQATEMTTLAATAATRVGREIGAPGHATFGPVTAGIQRVENELLLGRPDRALATAASMPAGPATGWKRHRVDVARAAVMVGDVDRATEIMTELRLSVPGWLRHQMSARDTARLIIRAQKRRLTEPQRALAKFMDV